MQSSRTKALRERYESLSDDELQFIATDGGLAPEAKAILDRELARRGIHDLKEYKEALDRDETVRRTELKRKLEQKHKFNRLYNYIGLAVVLLIFLAGAYRIYFEGNERDGKGMMIAAALAAPFLFVRYYAYRLIWRILLRP